MHLFVPRIADGGVLRNNNNSNNNQHLSGLVIWYGYTRVESDFA